MNYKQTLEKITTDERFASYQNYDPDLLQNLEYFNELPYDLVKFCYSLDEDGSEPYFENVVDFVELAIEMERQRVLFNLDIK